jgi:hypothetical protein
LRQLVFELIANRAQIYDFEANDRDFDWAWVAVAYSAGRSRRDHSPSVKS